MAEFHLSKRAETDFDGIAAYTITTWGPEQCARYLGELYELGRLSSGAAAQLASVPRVVFLTKLGELGATVFRQARPSWLRTWRVRDVVTNTSPLLYLHQLRLLDLLPTLYDRIVVPIAVAE